MEVLSQVNAFYSNAFSNLVIFTVSLLAFVGVFIPVVVDIYQRRRFQHDKDALLAELRSETETHILELEQSIEAKVHEHLEKHHQELDVILENAKKDTSHALGGIFFIQAKAAERRQKFEVALMNFLYTAKHCIDSEDEMNLGRSLNNIERTVPKTHINKFINGDNPELEFGKVVEMISKFNANGRYQDQINRIETLMIKLSETDS